MKIFLLHLLLHCSPLLTESIMQLMFKAENPENLTIKEREFTQGEALDSGHFWFKLSQVLA